MNLNLDARREALGEAPFVVFKGEKFTVDVEMPYSLVEAYEADLPIPEYAHLLLGDTQWERLKALRPSTEEVKAIALHDYWGVPLGEGQASDGSSESNGSRSRPTSGASSTPTSAKRSGARKRNGSASAGSSSS